MLNRREWSNVEKRTNNRWRSNLFVRDSWGSDLMLLDQSRSFRFHEPALGPGDQILHLNIGGTIYSLLTINIKKFPETFLAKFANLSHNSRMKCCDAFFPHQCSYYFDRPGYLFESICTMYRTGILRPPPNVCLELFVREMKKWKIDIDLYRPCKCCHPGRNPDFRGRDIQMGSVRERFTGQASRSPVSELTRKPSQSKASKKQSRIDLSLGRSRKGRVSVSVSFFRPWEP